MSGLLKNKMKEKKGIAHFVIATEQTAVTTGTVINIFEESLINNSANIVKLSNSQVQLKAGRTYKLMSSLRITNYSSASGEHQIQFYNVTAASYIGSGTSYSPLTSTLAISNQTEIIAIVSTSVDTTIELRDRSASGTANVYGATVRQSHVIIEELEAYIPSVVGTQYADRIVGNSTSGVAMKGRTDGQEPASGDAWELFNALKLTGSVTGPASAGTYVDITGTVTVPAGNYMATYYVSLIGKATTPDVVLSACIRDSSNNIVTNSQFSGLVQNSDTATLFLFVPIRITSAVTYKLSATANVGYAGANIWTESLTSLYSDENRARLTFERRP